MSDLETRVGELEERLRAAEDQLAIHDPYYIPKPRIRLTYHFPDSGYN